MAASQILGLYVVTGSTGASYTLTGANRNASIGATPGAINMNCVNSPNGSAVYLIGDNVTTIKRARLRCPAGPGMNSAQLVAAQIVLSFQAILGGSGDTELDAIKLTVPKWGEWLEVNAKIKPFKTAYSWNDTQVTQHKPVGLFIGSASNFNFDDFNIQADYVGEAVAPVLDLEIDTAGVVDANYYTIL